MQFLFQILPHQSPGWLQFFHASMGCTFIQQVNGLIRQKQVRQIPDRQAHCFLQRFLGNPDPVMPFQTGLQAF